MKDIFLRITLAISLDGKIARFKGDKVPLGDTGDRKVLEKALDWADATLMGAETLRVHKSICLIHENKLLQKRIKKKKMPQPISIVISNDYESLLGLPFFNQPVSRWLITSKEIKNNNQIKGYDRVIMFEENWSKTLIKIAKFGISKLLILGGSQVTNALLLEDKVNELQLTITPKLVGGDVPWIPGNMNTLPDFLSMKNAWILKENKTLSNNEIMLLYRRNKK